MILNKFIKESQERINKLKERREKNIEEIYKLELELYEKFSNIESQIVDKLKERGVDKEIINEIIKDLYKLYCVFNLDKEERRLLRKKEKMYIKKYNIYSL